VILHILKRDLVQLRLLVVVVAAAQLVSTAFWFMLGNFQEPGGLVPIAYVISTVTILGVAALIASAVHLDILPGVSQDWLIRPVRRTDLLCAKLLFVLVAVQLPMLLIDVAHGLATGFSIADSLQSAAVRSLYMILILDLPILALAAVTRSLIQIGAALLAIWVVVMAGILLGVLARGGNPPPFSGSGLQWMTPAFWSLLVVVAGVLIVPMQYLRRATVRARVIAVGAAVFAPALSYTTWSPAFAVQTWLSPDRTTAKSLAIAYDPAIGRSATRLPVPSPNAILLPLRVSGLGSDSIVLNDRTYIRLVGRDGTTLYRGRTTATIGYGDDFPVRSMTAGNVITYQRIVLPAKVYASVYNKDVGIELDYSLTLLQAKAMTALPATDGSDRSPAFGWCRTEIDEDGDGVELGCVRPGGSPTCIAATLANPKTGEQNPENVTCEPDYSPFRAQIFPISISHFGTEMRFRDIQGLAKYPVDGAQLSDAMVTLKSYEPIAHFMRHLVIPKIRLGDWSTS
jgi:hypothetical protein